MKKLIIVLVTILLIALIAVEKAVQKSYENGRADGRHVIYQCPDHDEVECEMLRERGE